MNLLAAIRQILGYSGPTDAPPATVVESMAAYDPDRTRAVPLAVAAYGLIDPTTGKIDTITRGLRSPADISGLKLWIQPQENGGGNGASVTSLTDLSGSGNDFAQLGATPVPTISTAAFGGSKSLLFAGNGALSLAHASSASLAALQAGSYTFVFLIQPTSIPDLNTFWSKGTGSTPIWYMLRSALTGMLDSGGGFLDQYQGMRAYRPGDGRNVQFLANQPHVVTVRCDRILSTGTDSTSLITHIMRVDGEDAGHYHGTPYPLDTTAPWTLGCAYHSGAPNFFFNGHVGLVLAYDSALSRAQLSEVEAYAMALGGITAPVATSDLTILIDGDSISFSDIPDTGWPWGRYVRRRFMVPPRVINRAIGGQTVANIISNLYLSQVAPTSGSFVAVLAAGTNDFDASRTAAQVLADAKTWCAAMRALGAKIVIQKVLPRTSLTGGKETARTTYNAALDSGLADGTLDADAISDPTGTLSNASDTTFFSDGTHLTPRGEAVLSGFNYTAINSALGK